MSNTRVSYRKQELLTEFLCSPPPPGIFDGVRVIYLLFSAVLISFGCVHPLSCVSNIAGISGLSILDCPFCFL